MAKTTHTATDGEKLAFGKHLTRLPSKTHAALRLNNICPYYTMFPLEFPFRALANAELGEWILDPFCGRGTTNFAARLRGLNSIGVDSNPVAVAVAAAKLAFAEPEGVAALCKRVLARKSQVEIPSGNFWKWAFDPKTLEDVCRLRKYLLARCSTPEAVTLRAIVLGILHGPKTKGLPTYLSNQMPRTYATKPDAAVRYWSKHKLKPFFVDVLDAVTRRASFSLSETPPLTKGRVIHADSRTLAKNLTGHHFDWVVTSPPYYGMRSYIPDQWLRNWFLGGPNKVEYSQVGQLSHKGKEQFIADLAEVWKSAATLCRKRSKLVIRFGALPSVESEPSRLIRQSLRDADAGWRVRVVRDAGLASQGRRQAEQFMTTTSNPIHEIDVYATLEP